MYECTADAHLNPTGNNWVGGSIPAAVEQLKMLEVLNLAYLALTGTIPSSFGNLTQLQVSFTASMQ